MFEYIKKFNMDLGTVFKYLDKDKSDGIDIHELSKGLDKILNPDECRTLFMAADKDNSNEVSYDELINECQKIHCAYVMEQMKEVVETSIKEQNLDLIQIFNSFDRDSSNKMEINEFNEMIKFLYEARDKYEIDCLFRHCDSKGVGYITRDDFKNALYTPFNFDSKIMTTVHELMAPLKTKLGASRMTSASLFERFAKGDKQKLTISDLKEVFEFVL